MAPPAEADSQFRHDLRTPLNHIMNYAQLMHEEAVNLDRADVASIVEELRATARQSAGLIDELVPWSASSEALEVAARATLNELIQRMHGRIGTLHEKGEELGRDFISDLRRVQSAITRLATLLDQAAARPTGGPDSSELASVPNPASDRSQPGADMSSFEDAPGAGATSNATLLVVDDDEQNRDALRRNLERLGYNVICADNGRQALELLESESIDLMLLDIVMPEIDGYEVLRRCKADARFRDIPVLMISAIEEIESVVRCIELGADDYLTKSFDPILLRARIGACLEKKRYLATIHEQATELAELNRTLEARVAQQVEDIVRLRRLQRFLSPQIADIIISSGDDRALEPHRREITVAFCDLRGFTAFAETAEPEDVMAVLRDYHTAMGELIFHFDGTLEHFAGDGMMIFFNDPVPCPDPGGQAVRMALAMRERAAELALAWRKRGHELAFGIGIAMGYATLGRIGFERRFDYGAIGSVTNLAARLCAEAAAGQILVSERVCACLEDVVEAKPVGDLQLKGFFRPVATFNILALKAAGGS